MLVKRNLETKLTNYLEQFPVVAVLGPRQCGKTTLAKTMLKDWSYFDLQRPTVYDQITSDPEFFFRQYPEHVILDEAQLYPNLFPVLRGVIDAARDQKGRFLLTGSSHPALLKQISESLAGRMGTIELAPLKANEHYQVPLSPIYEQLKRPLALFSPPTGSPPLSHQQIQQHWFYGGYPEPTLKINDHDGISFWSNWLENYQQSYVHRDLTQLFPKLNKLNYRRFLSMLAHLSGSLINKSQLAQTLEISEKTISDYLDIADGTFFWRYHRSFEKTGIKRLTKMPKGHLRDSGLLHFLVDLNHFDQLWGHPLVGRSFEGFVIEELLRGIQAVELNQATAYHYRTQHQTEIDLILQGPFGLLPIEIKSGSNTPIKQLQTLSHFIEEYQLPLGLVINQSDRITWLKPKILQLPAQWI